MAARHRYRERQSQPTKSARRADDQLAEPAPKRASRPVLHGEGKKAKHHLGRPGRKRPPQKLATGGLANVPLDARLNLSEFPKHYFRPLLVGNS